MVKYIFTLLLWLYIWYNPYMYIFFSVGANEIALTKLYTLVFVGVFYESFIKKKQWISLINNILLVFIVVLLLTPLIFILCSQYKYLSESYEFISFIRFEYTVTFKLKYIMYYLELNISQLSETFNKELYSKILLEPSNIDFDLRKYALIDMRSLAGYHLYVVYKMSQIPFKELFYAFHEPKPSIYGIVIFGMLFVSLKTSFQYIELIKIAFDVAFTYKNIYLMGQQVVSIFFKYYKIPLKKKHGIEPHIVFIIIDFVKKIYNKFK